VQDYSKESEREGPLGNHKRTKNGLDFLERMDSGKAKLSIMLSMIRVCQEEWYKVLVCMRLVL